MQSKPPKIKSIKIIKYIIFGSAALIATILAVVIAFKTLDAVTRQRVMDEAENRIAVFLKTGLFIVIPAKTRPCSSNLTVLIMGPLLVKQVRNIITLCFMKCRSSIQKASKHIMCFRSSLHCTTGLAY